MGFSALDGIETLYKEPKLKPKPATIKTVFKAKAAPVVEKVIKESEPVVRVPRTVPTHIQEKTESFSEADTLLSVNGLGKQEETTERRELVLAWMLNGHIHDGGLMTVSELAVSLKKPLKTIEMDISALKSKMAEFHTSDDLDDVPALAHMLMEMKFQDRGRALALYNIIMGDINESDTLTEQARKAVKAGVNMKNIPALTGRDRAAMYSAALAALDLSNKATNGMDQLFKLTGGAQRLQAILKAKSVTINNFNGAVLTMDTLQQFVAQEFNSVLPSSRKVLPQLGVPSILDLDADDLRVMKMGEK